MVNLSNPFFFIGSTTKHHQMPPITIVYIDFPINILRYYFFILLFHTTYLYYFYSILITRQNRNLNRIRYASVDFIKILCIHIQSWLIEVSEMDLEITKWEQNLTQMSSISDSIFLLDTTASI